MRRTVALVLFPVFALSLAWAAQEAPAPSYEATVEPIFVAECGDCHGADRPKKGLDLSAGVGYGNLVGTPSNERPEILLVTPGDAGASYLWQKLDHTATEGKGMPRTMFGARRLPAEQLDLIRRWIEAGAQP